MLFTSFRRSNGFMCAIALDHAQIGALDFLVGGEAVSALETNAAAADAGLSRDWRESMTLSSRNPHLGQRIVVLRTLVAHYKLWRQRVFDD